MPTEPFPPLGVPEHNGRYRYQYEAGPDDGGNGRHVWSVHPANYPAVDTYTDEWGKLRTIYYDPAVIQPRKGQFRHEYDQPANARLEELHPPEGLLWRGMSDEEYQAARINGYFESNGSYNLGDEQKGLTFFSTDPTQGENYANGFAPSQHKAAFDKPAHIVGIPMRPWDYEHETEKGIRGQVPFSDVTHHYVGNVHAILPGEHRVYEDWAGLKSLGGGIGSVRVHWSEDHPVASGMDAAEIHRAASNVDNFFFAFTPPTYTYRGPKVRPATPLPEGFVDTSDYNFTGTPETQYHHRSITPEIVKDISKRKDSIDDYYQEMRERRDSGLEPIPWNEWLSRVAYIRHGMPVTRFKQAMAWDEWSPKIQGGCHKGCTYNMTEGRYTLPQAGAFLDYKHVFYDDEPQLWISGIYTHPQNRNDGVAEALMRKLVEDHPGVTIDPGYMTTDGQRFHDRMLVKEPQAKELVTAMRYAMAWDEWAPKIRNDFYQSNFGKGAGEVAHLCESGGCTYRPVENQAPEDDDSFSGYWIDHGNNTGGSFLTYKHLPENRIAVGLLDTDIRHRRDGVAEALFRKLVEDHPGAKIIPGNMTNEGQAFHDRMLEKEPEARDLVTAANSLLVGPQDAYDEWDWFRRHEENPPSMVRVEQEDWYHVSPHRIPVGTTLAPMRGQTPWNDEPYNHGLHNRANWIWVEFDKDKARAWMRYILQHQPEAFIYRVQPDVGPFAWNGTAEEGWVTNRAVVVEFLENISRDLSFQERP